MLTNIFDNLVSELGSGTSSKTKKLYDLKQVTMSLSLFIYKIRDFGLNEKIFLLTLISVILLFYSLICSSIINYHWLICTDCQFFTLGFQINSFKKNNGTFLKIIILEAMWYFFPQRRKLYKHACTHNPHLIYIVENLK